ARLRGGRRLRPLRRAEHRLRVPAGRVRGTRATADRRDPRRAPSRNRRRPAALRSAERETAVLSAPVYTDPFAAARWALVPGGTALLVIDPQNDFLHEEGWYAQKGIDIGHMRRTIGPTKELLAAARARGVPVIWTRHGYADA